MLSFGKFLLVGVVVLAVAAYTRQKKAERARAEARRRPAVAAELDRRITSYNVCYTKLLRIAAAERGGASSCGMWGCK